jgi:hypothetical protein
MTSYSELIRLRARQEVVDLLQQSQISTQSARQSVYVHVTPRSLPKYCMRHANAQSTSTLCPQPDLHHITSGWQAHLRLCSARTAIIPPLPNACDRPYTGLIHHPVVQSATHSNRCGGRSDHSPNDTTPVPQIAVGPWVVRRSRPGTR